MRRRSAGSPAKDRMDSPSDWPVPGPLAHIAGQGAAGFRVVDVWESHDAFARFGQAIMPILQDTGVEARIEVYDAYAFVIG
jgi:hypothetical protein